MRTLTMEMVDLQKLCDECGLEYTLTTAGIMYGYYGNDYIIHYDFTRPQNKYKDNIIVFRDVEIVGNKIQFCNHEAVWNDEYNYNYLKETIIKAINRYKQKFLEIKEQKLQKDFE